MPTPYSAASGQSQPHFATPRLTAGRPAAGPAAPAKTQDWYDTLAQLQALYEELLPGWPPAAKRPARPAAHRARSARQLTRDLAGWSLPPIAPASARRPGSW